MTTPSERILFVERDPDIIDVVVRQALEPLGYIVEVVEDVNSAITRSAKEMPDLVITDLNLPGLNGRDLLVAFNSQGFQIPMIVIAEKGQENSVIQAFRLGASDYLLWPLREAEVVSAVERALKQIREERSRKRLDQQLKETNQELQRRVRELTTIFAVGKAVVSITDQMVLLEKIVEGMVYVAEADYGWLLLKDDHNQSFQLAAHRNLPEQWAKKMGRAMEDGVSSLVALSGETLAINGEPLKRFKVAALGNSVVVVPMKVKNEVIGLLVITRKEDQAFEKNMQSLLEAVADYASVSLVNARLFRALQDNAEQARVDESLKEKQLQDFRQEIQDTIQPVTYPIDLLLTGKMGKLTDEQQQALRTTQVALKQVVNLVKVDPSA